MVKAKNLVLHGVGEAFLLSNDGSIATRLSKLQSMSIEVTSESEDVYGGDSLFPVFTYIKSKSATFKFKDALFNMNVLSATQGAKLENGAEINAIESISVSNHSAKLKVTKGIVVDSVLVIADDVNMIRVTGSPVGTNEFTVTDSGVLTFASNFEDTAVEVSYVYKDTKGSSVNVHVDDVPGFVELRHTSKPIKYKDGKTYRIHTRVFKAVCDGGFNLEYTRDGAVAPEVTFKSVDPERDDGRFVSYSLEEVE